MPERLFAPAVLFAGARVPVEVLAAHLRVYVQKWVPDRLQHKTVTDVDEGVSAVYFPMSIADFVSWGAMLQEQLHDACLSSDEFLACFDDYAPGGDPVHGTGEVSSGPAPADSMYASLFISDDDGKTWLDKDHLQLKK